MNYGFKEYKKADIISNHMEMGGNNPEGEAITANSLYFMRGGIPRIWVMGEYHFVRDSRENWYDVMCRMKAGGIDIVATYIFWIYHEEEEGRFDFSGDRDLGFFVDEARRAGLDVVLRIGPWAHGECRNGGFPDWLMRKPFKLRESNPEYMEKVRTLYTEIYNCVSGQLYKNGGNIIGIQLENELYNNAEHLHDLKEAARDIGFDVPIYTVTGWNGGVCGAKIPVDEVIPVFGAYPEEPWAGHTEPLPLSHHYIFSENRDDAAIGKDIREHIGDDGWRLPCERYPFATCELGGGVQVTHMRRPIIKPMDIYAMSLVKLGSGNNLIGYYMYKGGINKIGKHSLLNESKESGYPNDCPAISYDFQAPVSEYGEIREAYRLINMLHMFVKDFGDVLAPMENVMAEEEVSEENLSDLRYAMRTDGNGGFVFVNHYQRLAKIKDVKNAVITAGAVRFPKIDVCGDISFIMPFNADLSGNLLEYATAQLLCRAENTYFFAEICGIEAEYRFSDGTVHKAQDGDAFEYNDIKIVTVSWERAKYLRKLSERIYIGENCDLYETEGGICAADFGSYAYSVWNGTVFERVTVEREFQRAELRLETCEEAFEIPYPYDLNIGGGRIHTWKKISVSGDEGFVKITEKYDVAQIYADGELVADSFYYGKPWRIPAKLIYGRECYLIMSDLRDDFYREF